MGKRFSRTELTGLILLALVIVAITLVAFFMRACSENPTAPKPQPLNIEVIDSVAHSERNEASAGSKKKAKGRGGKKKTGKGKAGKAKETPAPRRNPFGDTIPVD